MSVGRNAMIKLPSFTFLNAPPRSGKSTLADFLDQQDESLMRISFAEPLRGALLGTFYPDRYSDVVALNFRDPSIKTQPIPAAPKWTNEQFLIDYGAWLKSKTNDFILGDLAKRTIEQYGEYYSRFVFDDARTLGDISPFINAYGAAECLLVHIERRGAEWRPGDIGGSLLTLPGIRHIVVSNNSTPDDMLKQFHLLTGSPKPQAAPPTKDDL